ncbi:alpha/beta fold hydrolase [Chthonobacter albigriseus]|uniref:alpha/beta fold hydrolase n=1 Tax=Chthonobacter albigriseus TaxID=1683161 RepID=UPI0015EFDBDE|nr:alpha/beta hydrolase [Chthonobacter albigriseus]
MILGWLTLGVAGLFGALVGVTAVGNARIGARLAAVGAYAEVDGVSVHYVDRPADADPRNPGLPLVVIHGASGNLHEPRAALDRHLRHRRVIYVDRPGHGHSSRPARRCAAPSVQADVLVGLLDRLGVERAILVGHSWGGAVAAAAAVLHPGRVAGLVFIAPATHPWPGGVTWYYRVAAHRYLGPAFAWTLAYPLGRLLLERAAKGVFDPGPVPERYPREAHIELVLRPRSFVANAEDVADLKENVIALSPRYPEITAPTVIVTGDQDSVVWPSIHSHGLLRDIQGAEMIELPGAGHMPHHTHPQVVVEAVETVSRRASMVPA